MIGGAARTAALALLAALALADCAPQQTELLGPRPDLAALPGCGADIDVYGAGDTLLVGCGGPASLAPSPSGWWAPGDAAWEATLAGRLQAALSGDAELVRRFGRPVRVRACGSASGWLSSLAPGVVASECAPPDAPPVDDRVASACSDRPAPVMVLLAGDPLDRCHGGGADSARPDDEAGYAAHFAARLEALLAARAPSLALVGPATEWTPLPGAQAADAAACGWRRAGWARSGVTAWRALHPSISTVKEAGDLHEDFQDHHACCRVLGLPCEPPPWLGTASEGLPAPVDCAGAARLTSFWIAAVRSALQEARFACEG